MVQTFGTKVNKLKRKKGCSFLPAVLYLYPLTHSSKVKMNAEALKFDNLHYYKIGIGKQDSETSIFLKNEEEIIKIRTLETLLKINGDENKHLTYLKVDVEGFEVWSLKNWMNSNALRNVEQLGIEMHTSCNVIKKSNMNLLF